MGEPGSSDRGLLEGAVLAALGAVALTAERVDQLADALAEGGGIRREDARVLIEEAAGRWRGDATRLGGRAGASVHGWLREAGLVTRDELEELELRVAQLEHRLKQVERPQSVPPPR